MFDYENVFYNNNQNHKNFLENLLCKCRCWHVYKCNPCKCKLFTTTSPWFSATSPVITATWMSG